MAGGLMQLVAYGAQDSYLTGNPQITFFKLAYKRHTNFAMESVEQTCNGNIGLGKTFSCILGRNGDLIHKIYIEMTFDQDLRNANAWRMGHQVIDYVEVEIGGQVIDRQYGEWMELWSQLSHTHAEWAKLNRMISGTHVNSQGHTKVYVPLHFWFCRHIGQALPIIALQYHEVKLNIKMKPSFKVVSPASGGTFVDSTANMTECRVFADYIYLDNDERRKFAQVSHEYLIEQVQYSNDVPLQGNSGTTIKLRLNHPVKEIVWAVNHSNPSRHPFDFWSTPGEKLDMITRVKMQLNGQDRFQARDGNYFRIVQAYQHHTGSHLQQASISTTGSESEPLGGFYVYSFAIKPEEYQPSGTCNFSRIDNGVLEVQTGTNANIVHYYAVNYNLLRIMSGMAGVAFSN
jgi:hypothetical protein